MLPIALINEIDRLLREGELSQRKIADRLGVSRGTISAIASGRRGLYGKDPLETYSPLIPTSPPTRCPHCGYRVYLPCLICLSRQHQQRQILLHVMAAERPKCDHIAIVGSGDTPIEGLAGIYSASRIHLNGQETPAMVSISFPDPDAEKRALAFLIGRFSGHVLQSGEHLVPEAALEALAQQDIPFTVKGKATYEQQVAAIRGSASSPIQ